jgi:regulator of sigma E protease
MDIIGTVLVFLGLLVVLILVHEVGHFVAAKRAGITVQEFGIGFPPRIGSIVWRGTRYSLNWIPLGGFVKMLGEDGEIEADKLRSRGLSEAAVEQAMAGAFNRKPIWVRIVVLVAGVAMNFVLAGVLFSAYFSMPTLEPRTPVIITAIQPDSPASAAGLQSGDAIVRADGRQFSSPIDLTDYLKDRAGTEVALDVRRDGVMREVTVTPRRLTDAEVREGVGRVGFEFRADHYAELPPRAQNPLDAAVLGFGHTGDLAWRLPGALAEAIGGLLGLNPNARAAVGPIGIAEQTGRVLQGPLAGLFYWVALLSLNLAVLNVLPFPPLDGGRIAVVLIESVRRRRLPAEREALIYLTGFMVLIALVILISIQDVQNLIEG